MPKVAISNHRVLGLIADAAKEAESLALNTRMSPDNDIEVDWMRAAFTSRIRDLAREMIALADALHAKS